MSDNESDLESRSDSKHEVSDSEIALSDIESGKRSDPGDSDEDEESSIRKKKKSKEAGFFTRLSSKFTRGKESRSFRHKDPFKDLSPSSGWTSFVITNYRKSAEKLNKSADWNLKLYETMNLIRSIFTILVILFLFITSIMTISISSSSSILSALSAILIFIHEILRIDERRFSRLERSRRQRAVASLLTTQISRPIEKRVPLPIHHYHDLINSWSSLHDTSVSS